MYTDTLNLTMLAALPGNRPVWAPDARAQADARKHSLFRIWTNGPERNRRSDRPGRRERSGGPGKASWALSEPIVSAVVRGFRRPDYPWR